MFPLMLVLVALSLSILIPWMVALLTWRQRAFMPLAAFWFTLTNIFAGAEAVVALIGILSRDPAIVFWAEASINLMANFASWAFLMAILALQKPEEHRLLLIAGGVSFLLSIPPWFAGVHIMLPRLEQKAYLIYSLGDYPVLRFFVHIPWQAELFFLILPGIVFGVAFGLALWLYRQSFIQRNNYHRVFVLSAIMTFVLLTHIWHLQGKGIFTAINPMPALEWAFSLGLGWLVLSQHFGLVMPLISPEVLEQAKEGIIVIDRQGRLVWWNQAAWQTLGLAAAQAHSLLGEPIQEVLKPYPPLLEILHQRTSTPQEIRVEHPQTGPLFLETFSLQVTGRSGISLGRTLILYDLTPWRRMQHQETFRADAEALSRDLFALILAEVDLEEGLQRAAHLLRQPLAGQAPAAVSLWLLDEEGRRLWRVAWEGEGPPPLDGVEVSAEWWVADDPVTPHAAPEALRSAEAGSAGHYAWYYVLRQGEQPIGALVIETHERPDNARHRVWLSAAHTVALLIARNREAHRLHLMQQVYENIREAVLVFDAHGFVLDHNPAASDILDMDNLRGQYGMELLGIEEEQRVQVEQALQSRGTWQGVLELHLQSGRALIAEISAVQVPQIMGGLGIAVLRDVTERERLRQELERQKKFLEELLHFSRTLLAAPLSVTETWRATLRVGKKVLGADNASLILIDDAFRVQDFYIEESSRNAPDYWPMIQKVIDEGFAGQALRERKILISADTTTDPRWLFAETLPWRSVISVPLYYQNRPLGVMTFASRQVGHFGPEHLRLLEAAADMIALAIYNARLYEEQYALGQALLQAKEEAEALRKRQETFFANLSHEMRTPLQAILGYLEWLRIAEEGFLEYDEELRQIETAARRLLSIVNLILEYRRSQEEEQVTPSPFALQEVVEEVRSLVAPLAQRNNDTLHISLEPSDLSLTSDRQKVLHILLNLVSNAVKFTENGEVRIQARVEKDPDGREWVLLTVADTGVGIPEEALDDIFEPFRQADDDLSRRKGGTGLGLALVKRYTELLGGQVSVQSRVGQGTTFTVRLPRVFSPETEQTA